MNYFVAVSFGKDSVYEYRLSDSELAGRSVEEARRWFDKEFADLDCEPSNPVGKVLIIDKILSVARSAGEARFSAARAGWAQDFVRNTALALGRDTVRIDIAAFSISY